jgi:hypothetical protein
MTRMLVVLALLALSGCASPVAGPPPPAPPAPRIAPIGDLRRLAIVPSGPSKLTVAGDTFDIGPVFGEVVRWYPKAAGFGALVSLLQRGINHVSEEGRATAADPQLQGIAPGTVVAEAFARTLMATGRFDQVRTLDREPVGEDRRQADALVRLTVPAWGLVRVREGKPELVAAYADVHAQVDVRPTGVAIWEHAEDVTHAERLPLSTFTADGELLRQELTEVLERAGQRLANEFLYARRIGR